jgi:ABC-2 type transport system ATP-binding protein
MIEASGLTKVYTYQPVRAGGSRSEMWADFLVSRLFGRNTGEFSSPRLSNRLVALDAVSLTVAPGEVFGLLGPNGAGKTTLVKILCGIIEPTAGTARVNGHDVRRELDAVKGSVAVVQAGGWLGFEFQLSIAWNLEFWGRLYGLPPSLARRRARAALELVGLERYANDSAGRLSSGMRQRLAIAKGFILEAPLFLLDEPTTALDPVGAHQVREFIRGRLNRDQGRTVFLCTHNMAEAEQLCDRVAILNSGRIIASGRPTELVRMVGHDVVRVAAARAPAAALEQLRRARPGWRVTDRELFDGSSELRIALADGTGADAVGAILAGSGLRATAVEPLSPSLEDVFCLLAGKRQ